MMVIPSGRRSSEPTPWPRPAARRRACAAMVVMRIGRKRSKHASRMASNAFLCSLRCASSAKSIIMIAFFCTMPMSSTMPMIATTVSSSAADEEREECADARGGQRREDGDGMNVALVEHAQHDVDREQRREHQDALVGERAHERRARCPERRRSSRAAPASAVALSRWPRPRRRASVPGARLKDTVVAGNCPMWLISVGAVPSFALVMALIGIGPAGEFM